MRTVFHFLKQSLWFDVKKHDNIVLHYTLINSVKGAIDLIEKEITSQQISVCKPNGNDQAIFFFKEFDLNRKAFS